MKRLSILLFFIGSCSFAQTGYIRGIVSDPVSKETIVGASIIVDDTAGTSSDISGRFLFPATPGIHKVNVKFVGYKVFTANVTLAANDTASLNIALEADSRQLNTVVISAGKFEQNLNEVTVSMDVIKPQLIESKSIQTIETAVDQVPGVNVIDGQANIRGGSGFSYGAGSRVLLMVDEMPMLSADAGDVKWTFLPIENCEQIEVIKGASSALFGSSALNGVINFRTAFAKDKPETKISIYSGIYDTPRRRELVWWKSNPAYGGINFYHAQKIKNFDLVIGGNLYDDDGYRELETERRYRVNANLRYRFQKKLQGLQLGLNLNTISTTGGLFLVWMNADSGAFRPAGGDLSHYVTYRTSIDPYVNYLTRQNGKHTLRGRFYRTRNTNNTDQESVGDVYYTEYQYQKRFENKLNMTLGSVYNYNEVHSGTLYGTHYSANASLFLQLDKKWDRLSVSLGIRGEYFKTDSVETRENVYFLMDRSKIIAKNSRVKPVTRAGVNYRLAKASFVRASFGQGFRFPSVAERFIKTSTGSFDVYPRDSLKPESGWSAEIGIRQGFRLGKINAMLDVAGFWQQYHDMMEFTFGQWGPLTPPYYGFGFRSENIGNTRISGIDASLMGEGNIGKVRTMLMLAYTYIDPRQTDFDPVKDTARNTSKNDLLKYRYRHSGKLDLELGYKKFTFGTTMRANSFMENIDIFFEDQTFFPGMKKYRAEHNHGDVQFDSRLSYQATKRFSVAMVVNNITNREIMGRPADIQPPRTYILQLTAKF